MNSNNRVWSFGASLALAVLATVPAVAVGQEAAGRVLVAVGDVAVVRGTQRIAAQRGTEVRAGDTIQVGAQSNTQIRLTDESIISLRPESTFRLTEYAFAGKQPQEQRAFYDLVAGGIRTVTGLIGKARPDNYSIKTETATIGIRGTHFSLVECNNSCRNRDGSLAPNGTYGGVTDGRISVTNQSGETVFGSDQYFQVASATSRPQALIAPPGFLRDTLDGRTRNQRPAGAPQQAATSSQSAQANTQVAAAGSDLAGVLAPTGSGAGTNDSGTASVTTTTAPAVLTTNVFQSTTDASTTGPAAVLQPTSTGTVFYRVQGPFNIPVSCSSPPCGTVVAGDFTLVVNLSLQRAGISANFQTAAGERFNVASPAAASGFPITVSGGQVVLRGTFNLADFPLNQGAFRCATCGPGNTPGFLQSISVDGTISGGTATLKLTGVDPGATNTSSFPITLTQQTPPNTAVVAIATPRQAGGVDARSFAFWNVQVDPAGKLLGAGPSVGGPLSAVGSAVNVINGTALSAGNLVWGHWAGLGSQFTDTNYATFNSSSGSIEPWITGTAPNTLPPSLGTLTFVPVGSYMVGTGVLNSANLTADFVNRSLALGMKATNPTAGNAFQLNAVTGFSTTNGRFSAGFNTVTCTGPCNSGATPTGSFGGFFAGPNAEGAGLVFSAGFSTGGTGVTGAVAFKR